METPARDPRNPHSIGDRSALAHPGHTAQSTVFRFHDAQRARRISRLLLVLLLQRTPAAFLEPALPARLQHRPAPVLLAVSFALAIPLERVSARGCEAELQARGSRLAHAVAVPVLGRIPADLLHVFLNAGILFDAVLSGVGAA